MKTVSQAEFGRMVGVSRARVGQWKNDGIIRLEPNGKIDVEKARKDLKGNLDESKRLDWEECHRGKNRRKDEPVPSLNLDFSNYLGSFVKKLKC